MRCPYFYAKSVLRNFNRKGVRKMLTAKQEACIELMVEGKLTQKKIASQIKVTEQTICGWKKNDEFMAEYESRLKKRIKSSAAKAFQTMSGLLEAKNDMVRLQAAKDILDRSGFKPGDNISLSVEPVVIVNDLTE